MKKNENRKKERVPVIAAAFVVVDAPVNVMLLGGIDECFTEITYRLLILDTFRIERKAGDVTPMIEIERAAGMMPRHAFFDA